MKFEKIWDISGFNLNKLLTFLTNNDMVLFGTHIIITGYLN